MQATVQIIDVYRIHGIGAVPVGQVKDGVLKLGMQANIGGKLMTVKTIEMHHQQHIEAKPGDNFGMSMENSDYDLLKAARGQAVVFSEGAAVAGRQQQSVKPGF